MIVFNILIEKETGLIYTYHVISFERVNRFKPNFHIK